MSEIPPSGAPNYGSAIRVAQIVHWLHQFPYGITMEDLAGRLSVSTRTLARYVNTLKECFQAEDGDPLVELTRSGGQSRLRFRQRNVQMKGNAYELMSMYMALDLMAFLDGTFLQIGAQDVLDRMQRTLQREHGHETNLVLKDFRKKFFHFTEAPKDYSEHNQILDRLVNALVFQKKVEITYKSPGKAEKKHIISPLSLMMYKRGLYLIGRRSHTSQTDLTFAVERIQDVAATKDTFHYPYDYDPGERFQGTFGIVREHEPQEIKLWFSPTVAVGIESRRWHPSQKSELGEDGSLTMTLKTDIGAELIGWIMGYGHFVKVLSPVELQQQVVKRLQDCLSLYEKDDD